MRKKIAPGFTLIELLASISVLLILVVVTSQIVGAVANVFRSGKARIDTFGQARITFGELDRDFRQMVLRPDLAAFEILDPVTNKPAPALAFYTRVQGSAGDRALSLVQYRIDQPSDQLYADKTDTVPLLDRHDYGLGYTGVTATRTLPFASPTPAPFTDLADTNTNVKSRGLARGVVRLEWRFIDATGALSTQNAAGVTCYSTPGDRFFFNYSDPNATSNTRTVQLSLLVLDSVSYDLLVKTGQLTTLQSDTGGTPLAGETLGQSWQRKIDTATLSPSLPKPVVKALRVFEHTVVIPLNR